MLFPLYVLLCDYYVHTHDHELLVRGEAKWVNVKDIFGSFVSSTLKSKNEFALGFVCVGDGTLSVKAVCVCIFMNVTECWKKANL